VPHLILDPVTAVVLVIPQRIGSVENMLRVLNGFNVNIARYMVVVEDFLNASFRVVIQKSFQKKAGEVSPTGPS
jgi:hypothetical protein